MDRRQKKTREAIFGAFSALLAKKHFNQITVAEIIEKADVGRATFYAHFETKDYLLKELCEELFCHVFDSASGRGEEHNHIFNCNPPSSVVLHLLEHLQRNDNNILELLACENNELFLRYFKDNLKTLMQKQADEIRNQKPHGVPDDYWVNYASAAFVETVRWWIEGGMKDSAKTIADYYLKVI